MDKISSVKDLLNDAYLARTRYHNDNAYREYLKKIERKSLISTYNLK